MELSSLVVRAAAMLAAILVLAWGLWLVGWLAFDGGSRHPAYEGRGIPTTVRTN